ncbi:MAG TPA: PBP1A family penicillin-binding protein, partial [Bdellovibrionales bacterium]|nr:PBP1A family penicillin-binding protein [Bdellovibrionales bacterium]
MTSGEKRQGASTITQQVARSLLLSSEKTYTRKVKEILLAQKMERNLSKQDILFLYLNQIYFGDGAYGVGTAAEVYFRKTPEKLTVAEAAILAGLPQAPSSYSPTRSPLKAKARQRYVLSQMYSNGNITKEEYEKSLNEPITVYISKEDKQVAPYFVEAVRQMLIDTVGGKALLDEGLKIYTSIDYAAQVAANKAVQEGLRALDKRQGWRGALGKVESPEEQERFLSDTRKSLIGETAPVRVILPDGKFEAEKELEVYHKRDAKGAILTNIPPYVAKGQIVEGVVTKIDDGLGLVTVRFAEGIGLIDIEEMSWARKPDNTIKWENAAKIEKPSTVLKKGDIVSVRVFNDKFASLRLQQPKKKGATPPDAKYFQEYAHLLLEQKPIVEGSLISFDQRTGEVIAMVGGFEFVRNKNEFNRTIQAKRQTGSSFKTIVYAAALDRGYTPATPIQDAPIVYDTQEEGQEEGKTWKPHNHGQKFEGDILFRKALIRSLNIPTVKILEDVGVQWAMDYAKRLGVFSPLNPDLSLGLGSSSLTLYEMTKVFSQFGRLGQRIRPIVIHKVLDHSGRVIQQETSLDKRFEKEIADLDAYMEERRVATTAPPPIAKTVAEAGMEPGPPRTSSIFFDNANQLIRPQTAYLMTTLLSAVVNEEGGTAGKARVLGRPVAGKTGSTNGYFDGWFVGYSPQVATGVWVGFDEEKSLGLGEVGGDTALPIWLDYMKVTHEKLPPQEFSVPPGIVFANIDSQTGRLASSSSQNVVRQAFIEGTEPKQVSGRPSADEEAEFLKKDLTD